LHIVRSLVHRVQTFVRCVQLQNTPYNFFFLAKDALSLSEEAPSLFEDALSLFEDAPSLFEDTLSLFEDALSLFEDTRSLFENARSLFEDALSLFEDAQIIIILIICFIINVLRIFEKVPKGLWKSWFVGSPDGSGILLWGCSPQKIERTAGGIFLVYAYLLLLKKSIIK